MTRVHNDLTPIGIDLTPRGVRVLQLQRGPQRWRVSAAGGIEVPPDAGEPASAWYRDALATVLDGGAFRGTQVVTLVPDHALQVARLRIGDRRHVRRAARAAATTRFGLSSADPCRFFHAGRVRHHGRQVHELVALACAEPAIAHRLALCDELSLMCCRIDVACGCIARARALVADAVDDAVGVDIGERTTQVVVSNGRRLRYVRRLDVGAQAMRAAIARRGQSPGQADGARVQRALEPLARRLGRAVESAASYCRSTFRGRGPRSVFHAGEAFAGTNFIPTLSAYSGLQSVPLRLGAIIEDPEELLGPASGPWIRCVGAVLAGGVR